MTIMIIITALEFLRTREEKLNSMNRKDFTCLVISISSFLNRKHEHKDKTSHFTDTSEDQGNQESQKVPWIGDEFMAKFIKNLLIISFSNAIVNKRAMVIKNFNTIIAVAKG